MGEFFQERYEKKIARSDVVLKKKNQTHLITLTHLSKCFLYWELVILTYVSFKRSFFTETSEETKSTPYRKKLCRFSEADSS